MNTPICEFVSRYAESGTLRLHMPGHKGQPLLGCEARDITEIAGADSLFEAAGIIRESEQNAGTLFGAHTFYSTEGSSLAIRAMLYLACLIAKEQGRAPRILAGRNAHKVFLSAAALLDFEVEWLYPAEGESYLSCTVDPVVLERELREKQPVAVYLTSPDYLGHVADVAAIAEVCHRYGALLLVDNAHGAYLKFLPESRHPMDLGADLCCDSAHKTLPVLTGGAYLHIAHGAPAICINGAKTALSLFGSTSPSYLILQSLDAANAYLAEGYRERLSAFLEKVKELKTTLQAQGYSLEAEEPLKLTLATKCRGYTGQELAEALRAQGIECEFADPDFVVLMLTPELGEEGLARLEDALLSIPAQPAINELPPTFHKPERVLSPREALLSAAETVAAGESAGRILATATVACPPAVPLVVSGERIDEAALQAFAYYGITTCTVVKD